METRAPETPTSTGSEGGLANSAFDLGLAGGLELGRWSGGVGTGVEVSYAGHNAGTGGHGPPGAKVQERSSHRQHLKREEGQPGAGTGSADGGWRESGNHTASDS